jgi:hypothetical protein
VAQNTRGAWAIGIIEKLGFWDDSARDGKGEGKPLKGEDYWLKSSIAPVHLSAH